MQKAKLNYFSTFKIFYSISLAILQNNSDSVLLTFPKNNKHKGEKWTFSYKRFL